MNIKLELIQTTMDGDFLFDINNGKRQVGEVTISNDMDCHIVMIKANMSFHVDYKNKIDDAIDLLFEQIFDFINKSSIIDQHNKPVLLLEDEVIGSRYAITHNLKRVPRYCGFYLYS